VTNGAWFPKIAMKLSRVLTALLIIGGLAGCNLKEKYARNNFAADQWLQANVGSAGVNVQGAWEARESGWGDIRFEQLGSSVNGAMGNYSARGVVRGSRVFLALSSGGYVYYTVVLTKSGDMLSGFYSASVPFDPADQAAVTLRRIGN
jgi:hypothetical protein